MKLVKKLRKCWQQWLFQQQKPKVAERRSFLIVAVQQGKEQGKQVYGGYRLSKQAKREIKRQIKRKNK